MDDADPPPSSRATAPSGTVPTDHDLAGALHEVSNGLTVILGWLEVASEQLELATSQLASLPEDFAAEALDARARAQEALQVSTVRTRRAHRIARRAIAAPSPIPDAPELVGAIVREAVQGVAPEAERCEIRLELAIASDLEARPIESGDRLLQVLTNLLLNALVATPEHSLIAVTVAPGDDASLVRVSVADGGPGIPARDRGRLFQRGNTGRVGGAGIGLAHARDVVEELGGYLELLPYREGDGAHFVIAWPCVVGREAPIPLVRARSEVPPAHATEPPVSLERPRTSGDRPPSLSGLNVAVLDDDAAVVELLEVSLGARGANVEGFDALPALERHLAREPVDVALLDASPLGGEPLGAVLARLRAARPDLGVVLISGAVDPGHDLVSLGVEWMRKPFDVGALAAAVRKAAPASS